MSHRTVIFANGLLPEPALARRLLRADDTIIAADGGAAHALALGITPHLLIGDLDSVPPEILARLQAAGCTVQRHPVAKDETDLELALNVALENGSSHVLLLGGWGGRLDQSLANLFLLASECYRTLHMSLVDGQQTAWIVRDQIVVRGQPGDMVSVIALSPEVTGLSYDAGLRWRLHDFTLPFGSSRGISNEMTANRAAIRLKTGVLLVIHQPKDS